MNERRCFVVGESVEVSAKPCPGHPACLWEAVIVQVVSPDAKKRGAPTVRPQLEVRGEQEPKQV